MGFIEGVPAEEKTKSVVPWWKRIVKTFLWKKFPVKKIDKAIVRFYNLFGTFIWHPAIKTAAFFTMISGVILFTWQIMHRSAVITSPSEINLWVFGLLNVLVYLLCLALHELGHALVCKHHNLKIPDGGMALYLGLPCFYISTVNSWLSPPSVRIAISLAGSYVNLILAGIFIPLSFIPGAAGDFFFLMTLLNYMTILINLNPLGRFDGYYIAMDVMGIPALKSRLWIKTREALTALMKGKWGVIPRTSKLTLLYILIGIVYTVGLISLIIVLNWM
jgi:putative peptide zinc metalloprotease protein